MSPTFSTTSPITSTTQRLLQRSSRMNTFHSGARRTSEPETPPGARRRVVAEGLSTLSGFAPGRGNQEPPRGHRCWWSQESHWVWEGTPSPVQLTLVNLLHPPRASSTRTPHHRVRLHDLGAAMKTSAGTGVDTAR